VALLLLAPGLAFGQQTGTIEGMVTDANNGEALPGANVAVPEEGIGAATEADGQYSFDVPAGTHVVRASFVGYRSSTQEITVEAGETVELDFALEADYAGLDEVVVVGYGQQEREELTGSISSISAADIEDIGSVGSPEQLLQGQAGVQVTSTSGLAGGAVNVSVRGVASINGSSQPLYVVDGTPVTAAPTGDGYGQETNALSTLTTDDIQSLEVLKGASATAIYGSRAANGVVLITTKKGTSSGETQVSASYQLGAVQSTSEFDEKIVGASDWSQLHNEAVFNFVRFCGGSSFCGADPEALEQSVGEPLETALGFTPLAFPEPSEAQNFPWVDEVSRTGVAQRANISVRGGDEDTQYFISGSASFDESFVIENQFDRFSGRVNLSQDATDWLRVGTNTSITRTQNFQAASDNLVAAPLTSSALIPPVVPIRNEDGTFNFDNPWNIADNVIGSSQLNDSEIRNWRILSTTFVEAQPHQDVTLRAEGGVDALIVDEFQRFDRRTTDGQPSGFGSAIYRDERRYSVRGTATYNNTFASRHDLNAVVGTSFEDSRRNNVFAEAQDFASQSFRNVASGASPVTTAGEVIRKDGLASFFGRATYTLDGKYILEGSLRTDGSSRFGDDKQWGVFGSGSFAYRLGEEDFMQQIDWLSNLKLRGGIGWTGNNNLGSFFPQLTLASGGADYNQAPGLTIAQLGNPQLQWESKRAIEGGIDLGVLNDRIFLTATYYNEATTQLILDRQLPYSSGFDDVTQNAGEVVNQGVELSLETQNFVGEFRWTTSINATFNDNEVKELVGGEPIVSGLQRAVEGEEFSFFLPEYRGVDPETGQPLFTDADGGTTNNPGGADRFLTGQILPDWTGGFTNTFNYKGFDFRTQFTFEYGHQVYNSTKQFLMTTSLFGLHEDALDRWQEPGDQTDVPRLTFADIIDNSTRNSTRFLEDASYLRLQNLTFGYTLPDNILEDLGVSRLRVYFQGTNLLTFDGLSIGDPEGSTGGAQGVLDRGELFFTPPQQVTYTGGVQLQF
jgi:TonB-linked SusC/RagA family outer membrane protein